MLNLTPDTAGAHAMGIMQGVDNNLLDKMFATPAIAELANELKNNSAIVNNNLSPRQEIVMEMMSKYALDKYAENRIPTEDFSKGLNELLSGLDTELARKAQQEALLEILTLMNVAEAVRPLSGILALSKGLQANVADNMAFRQKFKSLGIDIGMNKEGVLQITPNKDTKIDGIDRILNSDFVYELVNAYFGITNQIYGDLFLTEQPVSKSVTEAMEEAIDPERLGSSEVQSRIKRAFSSFISQRLYVNKNPNVKNNTIETLKESGRSLHERYYELLEKYPDNAFLRFVVPVEMNISREQKLLTFRSDTRNSVDRDLRQNIANGFDALIHLSGPEGRKYAVDMFNHAMMKEGFSFGSNSITGMIDPSAFKTLSTLINEFIESPEQVTMDLIDAWGYEDIQDLRRDFVDTLMTQKDNQDLYSEAVLASNNGVITEKNAIRIPVELANKSKGLVSTVDDVFLKYIKIRGSKGVSYYRLQTNHPSYDLPTGGYLTYTKVKFNPITKVNPFIEVTPKQESPTLLEERGDVSDVELTEKELKSIVNGLQEMLGVPAVTYNDPNDSKRAYWNVEDKSIHFNLAHPQLLSTPFHEFMHPVVDEILRTNPELYEQLLDSVKNDKQTYDLIMELYADYPTQEYKDDEAIVHALTKLIIEPERLNKIQNKKVKGVLQRILDTIRDFLNTMFYNQSSGREVFVRNLKPTTSLAEIADLFVSGDLKIGIENDVFARSNKVKLSSKYSNIDTVGPGANSILNTYVPDIIEMEEVFEQYTWEKETLLEQLFRMNDKGYAEEDMRKVANDINEIDRLRIELLEDYDRKLEQSETTIKESLLKHIKPHENQRISYLIRELLKEGSIQDVRNMMKLYNHSSSIENYEGSRSVIEKHGMNIFEASSQQLLQYYFSSDQIKRVEKATTKNTVKYGAYNISYQGRTRQNNLEFKVLGGFDSKTTIELTREEVEEGNVKLLSEVLATYDFIIEKLIEFEDMGISNASELPNVRAEDFKEPIVHVSGWYMNNAKSAQQGNTPLDTLVNLFELHEEGNSGLMEIAATTNRGQERGFNKGSRKNWAIVEFTDDAVVTYKHRSDVHSDLSDGNRLASADNETIDNTLSGKYYPEVFLMVNPSTVKNIKASRYAVKEFVFTNIKDFKKFKGPFKFINKDFSVDFTSYYGNVTLTENDGTVTEYSSSKKLPEHVREIMNNVGTEINKSNYPDKLFKKYFKVEDNNKYAYQLQQIADKYGIDVVDYDTGKMLYLCLKS